MKYADISNVNLCVIHAKRITIMLKNMQLINDLRYNMTNINYKSQQLTNVKRERATRKHAIEQRQKNHENVFKIFHENSMQHFTKQRQT